MSASTIAPGYAYERAPDQQHFLDRRKTKALFRSLRAREGQGLEPIHTALYLDFLAGKQQYPVHALGHADPQRFRWQKPCYLSAKAIVDSFKALMETTDWDSYGTGRHEKCANCMAHCGYEPTAADATLRHPLAALGLALRGRAPRVRWRRKACYYARYVHAPPIALASLVARRAHSCGGGCRLENATSKNLIFRGQLERLWSHVDIIHQPDRRFLSPLAASHRRGAFSARDRLAAAMRRCISRSPPTSTPCCPPICLGVSAKRRLKTISIASRWSSRWSTRRRLSWRRLPMN